MGSIEQTRKNDFDQIVFLADIKKQEVIESSIRDLNHDYEFIETTTTPIGVGADLHVRDNELWSWGLAGQHEHRVATFDTEDDAQDALENTFAYDFWNSDFGIAAFHNRKHAEHYITGDFISSVDVNNQRGMDIPLYVLHPGQIKPQPAFIQMDKYGNVSAQRFGGIGNTVPEAVFNGRTIRWDVSPAANGDSLADLTESLKVRCLFEMVHQGFEIYWNGNNYVGALDDEAREASEKLNDIFSAESGEYTIMNVVSADDWVGGSFSLADLVQKGSVSALAEEFNAQAIAENTAVYGELSEAVANYATMHIELYIETKIELDATSLSAALMLYDYNPHKHESLVESYCEEFMDEDEAEEYMEKLIQKQAQKQPQNETERTDVYAEAADLDLVPKPALPVPDTMTDRDGKSFIALASQSGTSIHAVIIPPGEVYGMDNCLVHDGHEPLVEFWDATHAGKKEMFDPEHGQFVSRYYVSTIAELDKGRGLDLHGGEPSWLMPGEGMNQVRQWIGQQVAATEDPLQRQREAYKITHPHDNPRFFE